MIDEKNFEKIETFLSTVEGRRQDVGYIPCNCVFKAGKTANYRGEGDPGGYSAMGASGVTIATGVDLGQTDVATLKKIGVIDAVIEQLMPYIGLRRDDAIRALHRQPLVVLDDVAAMLDHCMHKHHLKIILARYDRDAGAGAYADIPWQAQAVVYSLLYQMGTGSPSKMPKTWRALVGKNWKEAAEELMSENWKGYKSRRKAEGKLLMEIV